MPTGSSFLLSTKFVDIFAMKSWLQCFVTYRGDCSIVIQSTFKLIMGPNLPVPWWPLRKRYICTTVWVSRPMYHWENFNEWIYHIGILCKSFYVPIVCRINIFQVHVQLEANVNHFSQWNVDSLEIASLCPSNKGHWIPTTCLSVDHLYITQSHCHLSRLSRSPLVATDTERVDTETLVSYQITDLITLMLRLNES